MQRQHLAWNERNRNQHTHTQPQHPPDWNIIEIHICIDTIFVLIIRWICVHYKKNSQLLMPLVVYLRAESSFIALIYARCSLPTCIHNRIYRMHLPASLFADLLLVRVILFMLIIRRISNMSHEPLNMSNMIAGKCSRQNGFAFNSESNSIAVMNRRFTNTRQ